ncbi:MAG: hypothetical protein KF858_05945 [Candidatus Sumerlaeia bacterium]|nr:hypothetical protein [Candidatus Sumerlaeia bacterium]
MQESRRLIAKLIPLWKGRHENAIIMEPRSRREKLATACSVVAQTTLGAGWGIYMVAKLVYGPWPIGYHLIWMNILRLQLGLLCLSFGGLLALHLFFAMRRWSELRSREELILSATTLHEITFGIVWRAFRPCMLLPTIASIGICMQALILFVWLGEIEIPAWLTPSDMLAIRLAMLLHGPASLAAVAIVAGLTVRMFFLTAGWSVSGFLGCIGYAVAPAAGLSMLLSQFGWEILKAGGNLSSVSPLDSILTVLVASALVGGVALLTFDETIRCVRFASLRMAQPVTEEACRVASVVDAWRSLASHRELRKSLEARLESNLRISSHLRFVGVFLLFFVGLWSCAIIVCQMSPDAWGDMLNWQAELPLTLTILFCGVSCLWAVLLTNRNQRRLFGGRLPHVYGDSFEPFARNLIPSFLLAMCLTILAVWGSVAFQTDPLFQKQPGLFHFAVKSLLALCSLATYGYGSVLAIEGAPAGSRVRAFVLHGVCIPALFAAALFTHILPVPTRFLNAGAIQGMIVPGFVLYGSYLALRAATWVQRIHEREARGYAWGTVVGVDMPDGARGEGA